MENFRSLSEYEAMRLHIATEVLSAAIKVKDAEEMKNASYRERMAFLSVKMAEALLTELKISEMEVEEPSRTEIPKSEPNIPPKKLPGDDETNAAMHRINLKQLKIELEDSDLGDTRTKTKKMP